MHSPTRFDAGRGPLSPAHAIPARKELPPASFEAGLLVLDTIRTNITLLLVSGYIILNAGFMLLRIPPSGQGVPLGELWLVFIIATAFLDFRFARDFANWAPIVPLFCWWLLGLSHLIRELPAYGFWAFRDAGHWMESNYLLVGFALASRPEFYPKFEKWLRLTLNIAVYYMLTYPFQKTLSAFSPQVQAVAGYSAPLVGTYMNASGNVVTAFFRVLLERHNSAVRTLWKLFLTALALVVMVVFFQMRTGYLQLVVALALLVYCRPQSLGRFGVVLLGGLIFGGILLNLNIDLTGRTGEKFSLDFLLNHIEAIWGGGDISVRSSAAGVDLRVGWWNNIFAKVNSSVGTGLFGLGFGLPLTNFRGPAGGFVREVHNSLFSVYARLGLVGLVLFLLIQARIYFVGLRLILTLKALGKWRVVVPIATTLCFLAMSMIFSFGEGGMEVSYVAIPYYFLAGVLLALNRRIRLELRAGPPRR